MNSVKSGVDLGGYRGVREKGRNLSLDGSKSTSICHSGNFSGYNLSKLYSNFELRWIIINFHFKRNYVNLFYRTSIGFEHNFYYWSSHPPNTRLHKLLTFYKPTALLIFLTSRFGSDCSLEQRLLLPRRPVYRIHFGAGI